eukprot:Colp12_sorted_trinity150504_noHs@15660
MADEETRKQFMELQTKMVESSRQVNMVKAQIEGKQREIKRAELVEKEIAGLAADTKTYLAVGKMFLFQPKTEVLADLKTKVKASEEDIEKLKKSKKYIERALKDDEDSLRDLIQHKLVK